MLRKSKLWKTNQDRTDKTQHSTTRATTGTPPRIHRTLRKSKAMAMENKTRQHGKNTTLQDKDPCLGCRRHPRLWCIECFVRARLWKTSNASEEQYGRQNKTGRTKHNTLYISRNRRISAPRIALGDFTKAAFYRNSNAAPQNRGPHFARACAVQTHLEISQEPPFTEIYKENCRATAGAPWSSTSLYTYHKNPSVWTHVWRI